MARIRTVLPLVVCMVLSAHAFAAPDDSARCAPDHIVSALKSTGQVPSLRGCDPSAVKQAVESADYELVVENRHSSNGIQSGRIVSQRVSDGTVYVTLSTGPDDRNGSGQPQGGGTGGLLGQLVDQGLNVLTQRPSEPRPPAYAPPSANVVPADNPFGNVVHPPPPAVEPTPAPTPAAVPPDPPPAAAPPTPPDTKAPSSSNDNAHAPSPTPPSPTIGQPPGPSPALRPPAETSQAKVPSTDTGTQIAGEPPPTTHEPADNRTADSQISSPSPAAANLPGPPVAHSSKHEDPPWWKKLLLTLSSLPFWTKALAAAALAAASTGLLMPRATCSIGRGTVDLGRLPLKSRWPALSASTILGVPSYAIETPLPLERVSDVR
jgi:hypothetical protein